MLRQQVKINKKMRWLLNLRDKLNMLGTMLISDEVMKDHKMSETIRKTIKHTKAKIEDIKSSMIVLEDELEKERAKHSNYTHNYRRKYYLNNKDRIKKINLAWSKRNIDKVSAYKRDYLKKNRARINRWRREYYVKRKRQ